MRASFACLALLLLATAARADQRTCLGRDEYLRYCAACHGEEADGNGPVASALAPRPPPLSSLRKKFGNPLSTDLVVFLYGPFMPRAHGTSAMPVWGRALRDETGDDRAAVDLLWKVVGYLDCIQTEGGKP